MSTKSLPAHVPARLACLLALASCTGGPAGDPGAGVIAPVEASPETDVSLRDFVDGVRLSGQFVATRAGESQQVGIVDALTHARCAFVADDHDQLRCLPPERDSALFWTIYTDPGCTVALAVWADHVSGKQPDAKFATVAAPGGRGFEVRAVIKLGSTTALFDKTTEGNCVASSAAPAGTAVLGPRVDPAMFVAASSAGPRFAARGSLTTWQIRGTDGSVFQTGLYDNVARKRCGAIRVDDAQALCLDGPFGAVSPDRFAESTCATPLLANYVLPNYPAPTVVFAGRVPHAVGPRWQGPLFSRSSTGACELAIGDPGLDYYSVGEELHPPELRFRLEGVGRIKREVLRDEMGRLLGGTGALVEGSGAGLQDADNGAFCAPLYLHDGSFRCVSLSIARLSDGKFADARCSVPHINLTLDSTFSPDGGGGPAGMVGLLAEAGVGRWGRLAGVFALGERGNSYYQSGAGGACMGPFLTKASVLPLGPAIAAPSFDLLVTNF